MKSRRKLFGGVTFQSPQNADARWVVNHYRNLEASLIQGAGHSRGGFLLYKYGVGSLSIYQPCEGAGHSTLEQRCRIEASGVLGTPAVWLTHEVAVAVLGLEHQRAGRVDHQGLTE